MSGGKLIRILFFDEYEGLSLTGLVIEVMAQWGGLCNPHNLNGTRKALKSLDAIDTY